MTAMHLYRLCVDIDPCLGTGGSFQYLLLDLQTSCRGATLVTSGDAGATVPTTNVDATISFDVLSVSPMHPNEHVTIPCADVLDEAVPFAVTLQNVEHECTILPTETSVLVHSNDTSTLALVANLPPSPPPPSPPPPSPPPPSPPAIQCVMSNDPNKFRSATDPTAELSISDVVNLLKVLVGSLDRTTEAHTWYTTCGDYDNNGAIQINDVVNMLKYLVGTLDLPDHHQPS